MIATIIIAFIICVLAVKIFNALNWKQPPLQHFPKDFNYSYEDITFKTQDGMILKGWFIPAQNKNNGQTNKTLVLMHGFEMDKSRILPQTIFLAQKYNLFYFDFRGMGESSGKTAQGLREYLDGLAAIEYLRENKPKQAQEIALYGISLGASVAAYIASKDKNIKAIILEACFYSYIKVASKWAWRHHTLPYFPVVFMFLRIKRIKLKIGLEDYAPRNSAPLIDCPVLQIHGKNDHLVPYKIALQVFDSLKNNKELWLVENGGHITCADRASVQYKETVSKFLNKYF